MIVLGVESSCDESAISIVEFDSKLKPNILFEEVASQIKLHALYGGVVPELAAREHLANLPLLAERALVKIGGLGKKIDVVAVTQGPGLKGCLLIGFEFAKGLSYGFGLPIVPVNHIEGHLFAAKLDHPELEYPFLALVVSGGHTEIIRVESFKKYIVLARTIDDAAGEAFDKSANLLGFEYPGGAQLAALADTVKATRFKLPKVMRENPAFSFSGLKTAISLLIKKNADLLDQPQVRAELAFAIQESIVDSLIFKLKAELSEGDYKAITLTGGVACNRLLREKIQNVSNLKVLFPSNAHCLDNAAMIALVGGLNFTSNQKIVYQHAMDLEVKPRWPIEE